ncbi:hypothetical protein [Methylobacterium sp. Leaf88]|uniref:hypothetical protein n=1 Tax=Methylobacterium sp. Leaf88 TaxID=1736244 RepID=UPI0006F1E680|nr:hypothetical protein [Methylobacterium sp. Leaf88]KQO77205.1 hypothetical protein ASF20_13005 [Methylobacterium sp. Leaf88]
MLEALARRRRRGPAPLGLPMGLALAALTLPALTLPTLAQGPGGEDASRAPAIVVDPTGSAANGMVDESALRYYAAQKQTARMKAEAARLKQLYPGWTEPTDLDTLQPSPPEEAPLWDLFTAGRFDDLYAAIAARRTLDGTWQPSDELARKLRRAGFRSRLKGLAGARRNLDVVALYRADPSALDPSDVESLWIVADALAAEEATPQAYNLYKSVLDTSNDTGARLATIQKAMSNLPMAAAEQLIALGRTDSDGNSEFRRIAIDITRARIVAFLHDEAAHEPTTTDIAVFQAQARKTGDPRETGLLGWYAYKRQQFREALDWFKLAISRGGDAMIAHGLAHSLRAVGMTREAEEVAYAWRDKYVGNSILFIELLERKLTQANPVFIDLDRINRYAKVTLASSSGEGAQALGWYAYNSCQFDAALEWFQHGIAWLPSESTVLGYALALQRLKRTREYLEIVNRYDGLFPKVVDLLFREGPEGPPLACSVAAAPPAGARQPAAPAATVVLANTARAPAAYGRVPKPDISANGAVRPLPVLRSEFPLSVAAENPFRYLPAALARQVPERSAGGVLAEPATGAPPLVARRVPGAGTMPYERYGFALLPGYNGMTQASTLTDPPAGTQWQDQQAAGANGQTRSSRESDRFGIPGSQRATFIEAGPTAGQQP